MRLVRVHADAEPHGRPQPRQPLRLRRFLVVPGFENDQHPLEPGVSRPLDDRIEVGREDLVREMTVTVDHDGDDFRFNG
jgi:hypothetical protein